MRAMYRNGMKGPLIIGQHKPGQLRAWTISLVGRTDEAVERHTYQPREKCRLMDLHDLVLEQLAEFIADHGEPKHVEWTAHGR